jgi:hypothetical protein
VRAFDEEGALLHEMLVRALVGHGRTGRMNEAARSRGTLLGNGAQTDWLSTSPSARKNSRTYPTAASSGNPLHV